MKNELIDGAGKISSDLQLIPMKSELSKKGSRK
jgi:hypothetical protein